MLIDVDNSADVGGFNQGRVRGPETHAMLVQYEFLLSLKWVPSAANVMADAISSPLRESTVRLQPQASLLSWEAFGPFNVDLMASDASVQCGPRGCPSWPFFSRYDCRGSSGVYVLAQDISVLPGTSDPASGYCSLPPVMTGAIVQHIAEGRGLAVLVLPIVRDYYWFPRVQPPRFGHVWWLSVIQRGVFSGPVAMDPLRSGVTHVGRWWRVKWTSAR